MRPSHPSLTLSSKNDWMASVASPSFDLAKSNSPVTGWKFCRRISRLSSKDFWSKDYIILYQRHPRMVMTLGLTSPFKYSRSNANRQTRTWISSTLTSFRLRLLNSWNGNNFPDAVSIATASASKTNVFADSFTHYPQHLQPSFQIATDVLTLGNCSTRSGYFLLISSEFRLKTATVPSSSLWT